MPKFAANTTLLFNEHPFLDRFSAAAEAGFSGVEFLFPYDYEATDLAERLRANRLTLALHNLPPGDWAAGDRGIACLPGREEEFRAGVGKAVRYAQALGCRTLNCLAGLAPPDVAPAVLTQVFIENLAFAAAELERAGVLLVIEAINTRVDMPGFFLSTSRQAFEIMDRVQSNNLKFQFDIYHMQIMEGDLARRLRTHVDRIGHMQLADNPGRHEPGTGEINFPFLFDVIDDAGYGGWIGCEYKPKAATRDGLSWFRTAGTRPSSPTD